LPRYESYSMTHTVWLIPCDDENTDLIDEIDLVEENDIRMKMYLDHIQNLKIEIEKAFKLGTNL